MSAERAVLLVHGGAGWLKDPADLEGYVAGVRGALEAGRAVLERGAREAVIEAVRFLEAETITNAGRGAALARDGSVSLDAGFMDGGTRRYGAVTGVRRCMNPVRLAAALSEEGDYGRFVGAPDSDGLTEEFDIPACTQEDLITERARRLYEQRTSPGAPSGTRHLDTVGAVALDAQGRVAAAVSTGGMSLKRAGRIGDSPVVGSGYWADDRFGACVTTGVGEALMREGTARRAVALLEDGLDPAAAARRALDELCDHEGDERGGSGLILVDLQGRPALDHFTPDMSGGWIRLAGEPEVSPRWRTG